MKLNYTFNFWQRALGKIFFLYGLIWLDVFLPLTGKKMGKWWWFVISQCGYTRHPFYEITYHEKNIGELK
jgi:hypothetical protein